MPLYSDDNASSSSQDGLTRWIDAIERYERGSQEWRTRCERIIKIYLDQHRTEASARRFALLWSNIETLKPAVYARLPVCVVSRRFKDSDSVGRRASEVLERCINTTFDLAGVDPVMQLVRDDRLLCSRGTAWVRYEAEFEDAPKAPAGAADESEADPGNVPPEETETEPNERVASERVCFDYVHWADFGHTLNRTWPEVTAVWRRVYMTRSKVRKRFGKAIAKKLNYEVRPEYAQRSGEQIKDASEPQAIICEIWDKDRQETVWLAKEEKIVIERGKPPLDFRNFFPCPQPVYGTLATGSLIPTPDYRYYQDQAEEINDLTERIAVLTGWLRLKGFYGGGPSSEGSDQIEELLRMEGNQILVKVESWAAYAEKGGVKGLIEWLPLEVIVVALREAVQTRKQLIDDVYQITGISDILRGETNPNETLGAQEIKAQTGSRRQSTLQRDIARFARDLAELAGEIISENFQSETIADMSGFDMTVDVPPELAMQAKQAMTMVQMLQSAPMGAQPGGAPPSPPGQHNAGTGVTSPPDPRIQQAQQMLQEAQKKIEEIQFNKSVLDLLQDEKTRGFRIEIETDSTIEPDENAEKQRRVEFLGAVGQFLQQAESAVAQMPLLAPLVGEMLMFLVRGFRAGRSLEDQIEQTMKQVTAQAQQPRSDPEQAKAQMQLQLEQMKMQGQTQLEQVKAQSQAQLEREKLQGQLALEQAKLQQEGQLRQQELQMTAEFRQQELEQDMVKHAATMQQDMTIHSDTTEQKRAEFEHQQSEAGAQRDLERDKFSIPKREQVAEFAAALNDIAQKLDGLSREMTAPSEIVRDANNRPVAVRKGSRTMKVVRDNTGQVHSLQ